MEMPLKSRSKSLSELIALRYDLAVDFYQQRSKALAVEAAAKNGRSVEYWAYRVFGIRQITSLALTLNPYWQFDKELRERSNKIVPLLYPQTPVPVNRTRQSLRGEGGTLRSKRFSNSLTTSTYAMYKTGSGWYLITQPDYSITTGPTYSTLGTQGLFRSFVKDTTWKSRNPGVKKIPHEKAKRESLGIQSQGEFERWEPSFDSPPLSIETTSVTTTFNDTRPLTACSKITTRKSVSTLGASASCDATTIDSIPAVEHANALSTMIGNMDALVSQCLPSRRLFNAFYQIAELKDLPQTLRGTLAVWRDIESVIGSKMWAIALTNKSFWTPENIRRLIPSLDQANIILSADAKASNAFLTFKFGYESMYQAVAKLIKQPEHMAKEINTLSSHAGSFVTLSSKRKFPLEEWTAHPTINTYIPTGLLPDSANTLRMKATRQVILRCVVNSGVRMPDLDVPRVRDKLIYDKYGLYPRPSDIYNLIPWSWLVDWYAGVTNYLRLIEEVSGDPQLINYGFLTYESQLEYTATLGVCDFATDTVSYTSTPGVFSTVTHKSSGASTGTFKGSYQLRQSIGSLANVKLTSGRGLSDSQKTILQALIFKFL